jgi:DNA phosphorothioation-dependent restriction protein DptH
MWRLAFQHLLISMLGYGFRVYSQQRLAHERARVWSSHYQRVVEAILADEVDLAIDDVGRLIVMDSTTTTGPVDVDVDGFRETIVVNGQDAATILFGNPAALYASIRAQLGDWGLTPAASTSTRRAIGRSAGLDPGGEPNAPATAFAQTQENKLDRAVTSGFPMNSEDAVPVLGPENGGQDEGAKSLIVSGETGLPMSDSISATKGLELLVGSTVDGFQQQPRTLNLSTTALNQLNIGVVGDLGTGKTQFLKSLIYQVAKGQAGNNGVRPRFLIFDYKKDYSNDDFVKATQARVQSPSNLPLNLFDISSSTGDRNAWLRRYQFFSDVLDKIYSGIGPVQRNNLKKAVKAAYDACGAAGKQPTIYDVHEQYQSMLDGKVDSIFGILDDLVDMELFAREPSDSEAFSKFLDGVVVIELNELGQDDRTKNMLVAVILNMFYEHMLTIPKRPYRGTSPQLRVVDSFLLVDEADNILQYEFDVLRKVLLQGREFGVGVILASQYLRHFKTGGTDYREPLLTWFVHKVPNVTVQELGALGLTADLPSLADRVKVLPNHHCLFKTFDVPGEVIHGVPFYRLVE